MAFKTELSIFLNTAVYVLFHTFANIPHALLQLLQSSFHVFNF